MPDTLEEEISDNEFLFRGIIEKFWDYSQNRPSSAAFKDSKGVSVDRSAFRDDRDCINHLYSKRSFFAVSKIKAKAVRDLNALVLYLPEDNNIYHSEIHDSKERVKMRGSKPKKLRDNSKALFKD
jgi:hypothetical protein